jgi:hypothetical protein
MTAMTCTECLHLVATADVGEMTTATAVVEHCRGCPDCAAVVDAVADETRRLADTLDGTAPGVPPHVLALRAVAGAARQRRRARGLRVGLGAGAAVAAAVAALFAVRMVSPLAEPTVLQVVELQCLSVQQAIDLAAPHLSSGVTMTSHAGSPIVMVRGPGQEVEAARQVVTRLDERHLATTRSCTAAIEARMVERAVRDAEIAARVQAEIARKAELDARRVELDAKRAELDARRSELDAKRSELDAAVAAKVATKAAAASKRSP